MNNRESKHQVPGQGQRRPYKDQNAKEEEVRVPDVSKLGPRSIYYDPQWNPYGKVPEKYSSIYKNLYYNPKKFHPPTLTDETSELERHLLSKTRIPSGDPPRFYKRDDSSITVERGEKIELMPTSVLRKKPKLK